MAQLVFVNNSARFRVFTEALDEMVGDPNIPVGSEEIVEQLFVEQIEGTDNVKYILKVYENGEPSTLLIETRKYLLKRFDETGDLMFLRLAYDTYPAGRKPEDVFTGSQHLDRFAYRAFQEELPPDMFAMKINRQGTHPELQAKARFIEDIMLPVVKSNMYGEPKCGAYISVDGDILFFKKQGGRVMYEILSVGYPEPYIGNCLEQDIPKITRVFGAVIYSALEVSAQDHADAMQAIVRNDDILQVVSDQFKHGLEKSKATHWFIHEVAVALDHEKQDKKRENKLLNELKKLDSQNL